MWSWSLLLVRIEEVSDDAADWDTSSSTTSDSEESAFDDDLSLTPYDPSSETLAERFYALRDIIPPATRKTISESARTTSEWVRWGGRVVGRTGWVVVTSALLLGLPMVLGIEGEQALIEQERAYMSQQNPGAGIASTAGAYPGAGLGGAPSAPATGVVPPGF